MTLEEPDADLLVHLFDEINESESRLPTEEYYRHLLKWGISKDKARNYVAMFDPKGTGFVRRDDVCNALHFFPSEQGFLGDVDVLSSDMSQRKRESVIKIILSTLALRKPKKERLRIIKQKLDSLYGAGWNVYIAEGRYWAVCSHKPGSNLTFVHDGIVYGVFQTPSEDDFPDGGHHHRL
nr:tegumental antigen [Hymenolepis microstoma]CDS34772.1 tegumental antigen [Hymenolepis microstoma]